MRNDTTKLTKRIGKRLLSARGYESQEEFAARIGVSRGYLSDLEHGKRELSVATLARVIKATGYSANYFMGAAS